MREHEADYRRKKRGRCRRREANGLRKVRRTASAVRLHEIGAGIYGQGQTREFFLSHTWCCPGRQVSEFLFSTKGNWVQSPRDQTGTDPALCKLTGSACMCYTIRHSYNDTGRARPARSSAQAWSARAVGLMSMCIVHPAPVRERCFTWIAAGLRLGPGLGRKPSESYQNVTHCRELPKS